MNEKYCSARFKTGTELDNALAAALRCGEAASEASESAKLAAEKTTLAQNYANATYQDAQTASEMAAAAATSEANAADSAREAKNHRKAANDSYAAAADAASRASDSADEAAGHADNASKQAMWADQYSLQASLSAEAAAKSAEEAKNATPRASTPHWADILCKPFGDVETGEKTPVLDTKQMTLGSNGSEWVYGLKEELMPGSIYTVTMYNADVMYEYRCPAYPFRVGNAYPACLSSDFATSVRSAAVEDFRIRAHEEHPLQLSVYFPALANSTFFISIKKHEVVAEKIDKKYLPDDIGGCDTEELELYVQAAAESATAAESSKQATVEAATEIASSVEAARESVERMEELLDGFTGVDVPVSNDAIELLAESGILTPAYEDGAFYTDENGAIYIV